MECDDQVEQIAKPLTNLQSMSEQIQQTAHLKKRVLVMGSINHSNYSTNHTVWSIKDLIRFTSSHQLIETKKLS